MKTDKENFILVGEDDIDDQDILSDIFADHFPSFSLSFMTNGTQLLEFLSGLSQQALPCLILLDYNMPGQNGAEITKELQQYQRYEKIPKIIWSTSGSDLYRNTCLASGATDYVVKPSNITGLIDMCGYFLSFCKD